MQTISRSTMNETKNVIQSLNKNITKLLLTVAVFHDENKITNFNEKLRNTEKPLRWLELKILCLLPLNSYWAEFEYNRLLVIPLFLLTF